MNRYIIKISPKAIRAIETIYKYIAEELKASHTAKSIAMELKENILSLETTPHRGAVRKIGIYANKGYRQLFVKNYTIVYRVDEKNMEVIVVTVKYTPSEIR